MRIKFKRAGGIREALKNIDFVLIILTTIAAVFGIVMISSAGGSDASRYVVVQSAAFVLGLIGVVVISILNYDYLARLSKYIYIICIILLVLVLIPGIGVKQNGARSWFVLGPVSLQPAEIVKVGFVITFSKLLSDTGSALNDPKHLWKVLLHPAVLCVLMLLQPDFGTVIVFVVMAAAMLFMAKISVKYIIAAVAAVGAACPIAWFFFLKQYQKDRIINLFNPENDPAGSGYHVIQSKTAVGSGKLTGMGLYNGASRYNNLLPERHTDFIYSVVCEELGMIGGIAVVILLSAIIIRCLYIGINARNSEGLYICTGVATMLAFQAFENIGMCIGIFPVTGITLPFFSYGGSSLLTNMLAIGLVLNVRFRYKKINF